MFEIHHYPETDSTNLEAVRLTQTGKISRKAIIHATSQSAGQGSRGRRWHSARPGNLLASYIFPIEERWQTPHLAVYPLSLGIHRFLSEIVTHPQCLQIKWPNDILMAEQKIAGALHEITAHQKQSYFIAGIGINIAWHPDGASETNFPATHLYEHTEHRENMNVLAQKLATFLDKELEKWQESGFPDVLERITPHFYRYQQPITVHPGHDRTNAVNGIFEKIDPHGALVLRTEYGLKKITAADIFPTLK